MDVVKVFPYFLPDRQYSERRFAIVRRADGLYTIADEYFYRCTDGDGSVIAEGWGALSPEGIYDSVAIAEREVETMIGSTK